MNEGRRCFGDLLRETRHDRQYTQGMLAEAAGISHTYVSKIEHGAVPPCSAKTTVRIAAILGVDPLPLLRARAEVPVELEELTPAQWQALSRWLTGLVMSHG